MSQTLLDLAKVPGELGIDSTLYVQFLLFLFIYIWLRFVFFGPFLKLIESRESSTEGAKELAVKLNAEAAEKEALYAERISNTRKQAAVAKDKILQDARVQAAAIVDAARKKAKERVEQGREQLESGIAADQKNMLAQADAVAKMFVEKLAFGKVGS